MKSYSISADWTAARSEGQSSGMRLLLLLSLLPAPAFAGGGFMCSDACSITNGLSCIDRGLGCNPASRICAPCFDDVHCWPGGTCNVATGACMGTTCTGDAGVDGGTPDAGDGAVDPDAGDLDAGPVDADPDATVDTGAPDTGAPDTGAPDTGAPDAGPADTGIRTDAGPIGRGPPNSKTDMFDEGCGCAATRKEGHAAVALFVIALLWLRQRW